MKVTFVNPGRTTFKSICLGKLFTRGDDVFVKTSDGNAVVVHKSAGHMNQGSIVSFTDDAIVYRVISVEFVTGD